MAGAVAVPVWLDPGACSTGATWSVVDDRSAAEPWLLVAAWLVAAWLVLGEWPASDECALLED